MAAQLVEKGIFFGNRAVRLDRAAVASNGDVELYLQAKQTYVQAMQCLSTATRQTRDRALAEGCRAKVNEYLARAEILDAWLAENEQKKKKAQKPTQPQPEPASSSASTSPESRPSRKPKAARPVGDDSETGGGDDDDDEEERSAMRKALLDAVVTENPNVRWDDVAGLEYAKEALKEAVILPKKFPNFFTGKRKPWKGVLLYGPPGTGKSYLAKAVATEAESYFISVSSADLVSKWQGDSEKLVKELFELARENAPSVIFIDEIDSLVSTRSDSESESSRRIKTQFLVQMDGIGNGTDGVLVLAATNLPNSLDDALLRRLERRVLIPLPDKPARAHMIRMHLGDTPHVLTPQDFGELADMSEGWSGSDLKVMCRDAIMHPVRVATGATHFKKVKKDGEEMYAPCSPGDEDGKEIEGGIMALSSMELLLPPITRLHLEQALSSSKPSVNPEALEVYRKFTEERGQDGA